MILVIETATAACSVALIQDGAVIAFAHEVVGRGHAERLIPMIASLPGGGRADRIIAGCGPGSFTGVRVGIAAARALALAWHIPACGYSTHAVVAARAFSEHPDLSDLTVAMEAGHGQMFIQSFASSPFSPLDSLQSLLPEAVRHDTVRAHVAGTAAAKLIGMTGHGRVIDAPVDARNIVHLPLALCSLPLAPVYGRAPDAKAPI